jgi:hypothetical protein
VRCTRPAMRMMASLGTTALQAVAPMSFTIRQTQERCSMPIRVTTRHDGGFDILTDTIDPAKSSYARTVPDYVQKITRFYTELGVKSAVWTAAWQPEFLESDKPVEYLLELSENRVIAYVDEETWSAYLFGRRRDFVYSRTPAQYRFTSVLVAVPVRREEVKKLRRYTSTATGHCRLQEEKEGDELQRHLNRNCLSNG